MSAYICYLLLAGIQIPLFYREGQHQKRYFDSKNYLTLCCIELILLAGFRGYTVGADTATYLMAIDYYDKLSALELVVAELVYPFDFEAGYFLLTKLSVLLGLGKTGFLFVVALIVYIPIFALIKKHSSMPYVSILCYFAFGFFSYSLGIFRQMIAISILLLGWKYIEERRLVKYLLIVALAMTFHTTAFVAILLYFIYDIKWERIVMWLIPIEVVLMLLGSQIIALLLRVFPQYAGYIGGKYDVQGGSYLMLILLNAVLIASIVFRGKKNDDCDNMTICALFLAICLQCLGYSMGIFGRTVSYFSIYIILAIPNLIYNLGNQLRYGLRGVISFITIICLFILVYTSFNGNHYVVPYYTIFG